MVKLIGSLDFLFLIMICQKYVAKIFLIFRRHENVAARSEKILCNFYCKVVVTMKKMGWRERKLFLSNKCDETTEYVIGVQNHEVWYPTIYKFNSNWNISSKCQIIFSWLKNMIDLFHTLANSKNSLKIPGNKWDLK